MNIWTISNKLGVILPQEENAGRRIVGDWPVGDCFFKISPALPGKCVPPGPILSDQESIAVQSYSQ